MKKSLLRAAAWLAGSLLLLAALAWAYYQSLGIDRIPRANAQATVADIDYLQRALPRTRGRILTVVSSTARSPDGKKKAGYELTELARAYYVFRANGYEVDIASPKGGTPPVEIDDMGEIDHAFLNDTEAQARVSDTLKLADIDPAVYAAVYFVGGKGAMFDFPANADVARIVGAIAARGVVGAVCHGPAALIGIKQADGTPLMANRRMTAFTNAEELFVNEQARATFGTLLRDRAVQDGARFSQAPLFLDHSVTDGRLVTGQNPWSTWSTAEGMIRALGHTPLPRLPTPEEKSVRILAAYQAGGFEQARREQAAQAGFDKMLLLMHAVVAGMEWRLGDAFQLQRLAKQ